MFKTLSVVAVAVAVVGLGLIAAGPASATSAATPSGVGYVAAPKAFHSVRVTVTVPTVHCTKSATTRSVRLGLFVEVRTSGKLSLVSNTVDASCRSGVARYSASDATDLEIHDGDRIVLTISGTAASSSSVEDRTTGEAEAGGGSSSGPRPHAQRHVLIGAQVAGHRPSVLATFANAKVDGRPLAHIGHRRTDRAQVTALKDSGFHVRLGPH